MAAPAQRPAAPTPRCCELGQAVAGTERCRPLPPQPPGQWGLQARPWLDILTPAAASCQRGEPPQARPAPRPYVPTPRTEEAAWAASALTFLLVVLTLAILYTRLHRRFHKSQSLYWAPSDAGQEPVSAVLKRRLLAAPSRRKKRPRPQQRQLLLQEGSSESSD
ncbi:tumor protein p53-inducible protein 13 isoform X2 [Carettochelys insculpta]|uniref:tumor protein p53-inducible protein 13 isoform X2 n=1 Tax=Carettochelys insculpta TaxID=44489 RepID=UPI003EBB58F5